MGKDNILPHLLNPTFNQNQTLKKSSSLTLKTLCTLKHFQYYCDSFLTQNYSLSRPQSAWICKRIETKLQNNFTLTSE